MGSAFAGLLAVAGNDVLLVGRSHAHVETVVRHGLRIEGADGTSLVARPAATSAPGTLAAGAVDVLVLLTKTFDNEEAVTATAHLLSPLGFAVSLQNGLGNERHLAAAFGPERTLIGVTTVGAHLHEPGRITITPTTAAGTSLTQLGPIDGVAADMAAPAEFARRCSDARLPAVATDQVNSDIWAKLALAVMGPASAVLRRSVVRVWERPEGRRLIRSMFDEVVAVAHAEGVALDAAAAWEHSVRTYEGTGDHTTSMCTDVLRHRHTEIEAMAGEVARRATAHGIPTPVHDTVCDLIRVAEATYAYDRERITTP